MVKVVVLDAGPLNLLAAPPGLRWASGCHGWAAALRAAGHRLVVPEIADYEVRRELLRRRSPGRIGRLNRLHHHFEYQPLDTWTMQRAAELWAQARHTGRPTAGDDSIDADMILIAQAEMLAAPNTVIATTNLRHLQPFFPAELWTNIAP